MLVWRPYGDLRIPGSLEDVENMVPYRRGYRTSLWPTVVVNNALAANCIGAAVIQKNDATARVFAGTTTNLYELSAGSWTDRTRASGGNYAAASGDRWRFAQYGDVTIATNKTDTAQTSSSGAFANDTGITKGRIPVVQSNILWMFDTSASQAGWATSAVGDYNDFTVSDATDAANGELNDTPGPITAAVAFRGGVVAFKARGMWFGEYVGRPLKIRWRLITTQVGCSGPDAVVNIDDRLVFVGERGVWMYDGATPEDVSDDIWKYAVETILKPTTGFLENIFALHDRENKLVYFHVPSAVSPLEFQRWLAFHYTTGRWSKGTFSSPVPTAFIRSVPYLDKIASLNVTTSDGEEDISHLMFLTDEKLYQNILYEPSGNPNRYMLFTHFPPKETYSKAQLWNLKRVYPVFNVADSAASSPTGEAGTITAVGYKDYSPNYKVVSSLPATAMDTNLSRWDVNLNGRFFRGQIDWTKYADVEDLLIEGQPGALE